MKKVKNINFKDLILIIINVFLIIVVLIIIVKIKERKTTNNDDMMQYNYELDDKTKDNNTSEDKKDDKNDQTNIQSMSEYERMQYYFAQYITYIENKDYEKAYSLLYPEFKDTYFPTLETYTEYVKKLYPKFVSFEYENFTRQGYVYILTVKIIDPVNGSKEDTKTQRIILKENNFYDYVLSFQVI